MSQVRTHSDLVLKLLGENTDSISTKIDSVLGVNVDPSSLWIIGATLNLGGNLYTDHPLDPSDTGVNGNAIQVNAEYRVWMVKDAPNAEATLTLTANTEKDGTGDQYTGSIYGPLSY